jgi:DNA polymerase III epsilon subunit family exonuclease
MLLQHSVFHKSLFPAGMNAAANSADNDSQDFVLRRHFHFNLPVSTKLHETPLVIFDTETTGLDSELDRIIEFGAIKVVGGVITDSFESFVRTDIELPEHIVSLTGITQSMLEGQPDISAVLPKFLDFIKGSIIVAHNAEFDMGMLKASANRLGYELTWPCFCTVKLARRVLPGLPNYKLGTLTEHFGLTNDASHRAVGDVKVLGEILQEILNNDDVEVITWGDVADCVIS